MLTQNWIDTWQSPTSSTLVVSPASYQRLRQLAFDCASQAYIERQLSLCGELTARKHNRTRVSLYTSVLMELYHHILHWTAKILRQVWTDYWYSTPKYIFCFSAIIAEKQKIYFGEAVFLSSDFLLTNLSVVASLKNCRTNYN